MNTIKFYPFSDATASFAPEPRPASKMVPEWYKQQPATVGNEMDFMSKGGGNATIKRCMPIFDLITAGYILTWPMDVYIDATNPEKITWSVPQPLSPYGNDMVATHGAEQVTHYPVDLDIYHKQIFRILPFWSVKTPPGYSSLFVHPIHRDNLPFHSFAAFVDTDKFISDGHLSMHFEKDFKGIIKQGTPLIQVIPIKRDDWEMELVEQTMADKEVNKQRLNIRSSFKHSYKEKFRSKKDFH